MIYSLLADVVLLLHALFILFVGPGGLLLFRWPRLALLHVPSICWAVWISFSGSVCPLTPLEQWLRQLSGQISYSGSFTARYIEPVIYPAGLTQQMQWGIGAFVLLLNALVYLCLFRSWCRSNNHLK
ncbi:MAG: DUF2784 domain-containing protein [Zetaproteobacteria bacterium CG_4_9_14_3_um_filter_53_7]|nr:MAG: DUF2784 domain-containing protein [Zetaproteobacteria bacterium CG_4_9_14_3_um_filter_53_7]